MNLSKEIESLQQRDKDQSKYNHVVRKNLGIFTIMEK